MQLKQLSMMGLAASILIFISSFLGSVVNGELAVTAVNAGGIWYLLPISGMAGIVIYAMSFNGKVDTKIASFVIGGIVLGLSIWFAWQGMSLLDKYVAMQADISKGFDSSFFTGKTQETKALPTSSFGIAFYLNLIAASCLLFVGTALNKVSSKI